MINSPTSLPYDPFDYSYIYVVCLGCLSSLIFYSEDLPIENNRILVSKLKGNYSKTKRIFGKNYQNQMIWNFSTGHLDKVNFEDLKFNLSRNAHSLDRGEFKEWILPIVSLSSNLNQIIQIFGENLTLLEHTEILQSKSITPSPHQSYDYMLSVSQNEVILPENIKYDKTEGTICENRGHLLKYSHLDLFRFCHRCLRHFQSDVHKQKDLVYFHVTKFLINNNFEYLNEEMTCDQYLKVSGKILKESE